MQLITGTKYWIPVKDADTRARYLYHQHYSCYHYADGRKPLKIIGPGEYMLMLTQDCTAVWAWRKFIDASGQKGINNSIFRNEGDILSSLLIQEAVDMAWKRWPSERRLYTYINKKRIRSTNPGYCYLQAGWVKCGKTKKGLLILELIKGEVKQING
jgi:hypothetical protein